MDFIQTANKQSDKFGQGKHGFSAGNPVGGIPATFLSAEWCDHVQQEIVNVIEGAGATINPQSKTQLLQAINVIVGRAVDAAGVGADFKTSVRAATTSAINLAAPGAAIDGVAMVAGDRFLDKDNATGSARGIYIWNGAAVPATRATDADGVGELTSGAVVAVEEGTVNADSQWMLTTDGTITIGSTALTFARKDAGAASGVSPGAVMTFAMSAAPTGWLKANGAAVSRTTYAALFAAIGTTFGAGDGSTTFNLPDLRGEFIRGWDDSRGIDSGRAFGSAQADAFQGHYHSMTANDYGGGNNGPSNNIGRNSQNLSGYQQVTSPTSDGTNGTPRTASETRPRNVALLACIKF